jgi:predicted metalloendopeptidase
MVKNILAALQDDLKTLDWMSPETKKAAAAKAAAIGTKIGYPDKWRDYSTLGRHAQRLRGRRARRRTTTSGSATSRRSASRSTRPSSA